jgi:hypothetical protein
MYLIIYDCGLPEVILWVVGIWLILISFTAYFDWDFNLNWVISPILSRKRHICIFVFEVKVPRSEILLE